VYKKITMDIMLRLLAVAGLLTPTAHAFYLPGVNPQSFSEGEQ